MGLPQWRAGIAWASAALVVSLGASSLVYAIHVKSEAGEKRIENLQLRGFHLVTISNLLQ